MHLAIFLLVYSTDSFGMLIARHLVSTTEVLLVGTLLFIRGDKSSNSYNTMQFVAFIAPMKQRLCGAPVCPFRC